MFTQNIKIDKKNIIDKKHRRIKIKNRDTIILKEIYLKNIHCILTKIWLIAEMNYEQNKFEKKKYIRFGRIYDTHNHIKSIPVFVQF